MRFLPNNFLKLNAHPAWSELKLAAISVQSLSHNGNKKYLSVTESIELARGVISRLREIECGLLGDKKLAAYNDQLSDEITCHEVSNVEQIPRTFSIKLAAQIRRLSSRLVTEENQSNRSSGGSITKMMLIALIVSSFITYYMSGRTFNRAISEVYWAPPNQDYTRRDLAQIPFKMDGDWHQVYIKITQKSLGKLRIDPVNDGALIDSFEFRDLRIGDYAVDLTADSQRVSWGTFGASLDFDLTGSLTVSGLSDDPFVEVHFQKNEASDAVYFQMRIIPKMTDYFEWLFRGQLFSLVLNQFLQEFEPPNS
ncbi:MAG: hypothetical protein P8J68_10650 [Arenicellaceae bacterium]|nr:hypothetical protein [Arenicellaceae bacterium]